MQNNFLARLSLAVGLTVGLAGLACAGDAPSLVCISGKCFQVEVVDTTEGRAQGLMGRSGIADGKGMWFVFPEPGVYGFWMKNVSFPLDMIWLDPDYLVVHVEKNVPPCLQDPCPDYNPGVSALYVLEIAGGTLDHLKLRPGDRAKLQ
ncbi:MAG: DUF192 domain-containing protein [Candidatus Omnitrophica bacterium]|nr:DUF192 domain-containing protein [Candidatus Omnitrophota bacterium]